MMIDEIDDIDRLKRINKALLTRVESSMDQQGNAFSLFQTAINLEGQVRRRTDELTSALRGMEKMNAELEKARVQSEKANLSKTKFLAAASHDILQPLNAALLSISVLADLQESPEGHELALKIERSLDNMSELLKTLLDISKLDAGVVEPRLESIPLSQFIEDLLTEFAPVAREYGLRLRIRKMDVWVESDRTMLRRILQNLLSNALRYTAKGGVLLGIRKREDHVLVDVIDTGIGIPVEHHEHVFEEFHRGKLPKGHQRDSDSGLGLGLSIVKRMASAMDHPLNMISQEGRGTRFRLKLPITQTVPEPAYVADEKYTGAANSLAGKKVLLIENDRASMHAGGSLLANWQCDVRMASTRAEAIDALNDTGWIPDVLIADLNLDAGDLGTIAVQAARNHIGRFVPALIVTAAPTKSLEREINDQRMELMHKPLKPAQLRAMLNHLTVSQEFPRSEKVL